MERITNHNRLIVIFLALTFPFVWAPNQHNPTGMLPTDRTLKPTLCGKLVFIDDIKTGAKLIGLIPCGESRPIVFSRRPGELHNFYRFQDVVSEKDKNMSISTTNYGVLYTFIIKFKDYVPIQSCSECKGFSPTATIDFTEPVIDCTTWILEESAAQFLNVINGLDINKIEADLEDNTYIS